MNFQQLRIVRETVRQNFNLTETGKALFTSQSGISKGLKELEDELGVEIFSRFGKRLVGLTEAGGDLLKVVDRILLDAENIKRMALQFSGRKKRKPDGRHDTHASALCSSSCYSTLYARRTRGSSFSASGQSQGNCEITPQR